MELVLLHGFDGTPANLLGIADAVRHHMPGMTVRLLTGPVRLSSGRWAWWNDGDERYANAAAALDWLTPQLGDEPVVVAGFSQGGALALAVAFAGVPTVIGVGCVGGFLPDDTCVGPTTAQLFAAHGEADDAVDVFHAESLARQAKRAGLSHTLIIHDGGHVWTDEVTAAFVSWLDVIGSSSRAPDASEARRVVGQTPCTRKNV